MKTSPQAVQVRTTFRIAVSGVLLLAGFIGVGWRLFSLQVVQAADLSRRAERQHEKSVPLEGERGTVYDRQGSILAANVDVASIYA
ncbi:MAG TPA: hypothetical protein VI702_06110, partial [Nitrospiria bacterium]